MIDGNENLVSINDFNDLLVVQRNLEIQFNPALNNINGFSNMERINASGDFDTNSSLVSISGFQELNQVGGDFLIRNNAVLETAEFTQLDTIIGNLFLSTNAGLNNINFPVLEFTNGYLQVNTNASLTSINFPELVRVGTNPQASFNFGLHSLYVQNNDALTNLDNSFPQLELVGNNFLIQGNEILQTLNTFPLVASIGRNLEIRDNPELVFCCELNLVIENNGVGATIVVQNNASGCNTSDEIVDTCTGQLPWYADDDDDGFGDPDELLFSVSQPQGFVADNTDCDDTNPLINPDATEVCDGVDNNCNNQTDEGLLTAYYPDDDDDGFGNINSSPTNACTAPAGFVDNNTDCDDTNENINPDAIEICDGADNNCNNQTDEGLLIAFYPDDDGDGFGAENSAPTNACSAPFGFVDNNEDCDDDNPNIHLPVDCMQLPSIELFGIPGLQMVECDQIPTAAQPTASDACSGPINIEFEETITNEVCIGGFTLLRTWTATNTCGQFTSVTQTITVEDNTPPSFVNPPSNATVSCNNIPASFLLDGVDNCNGAVNVTFNQTSTGSGCSSDYSITRVWTATDDCGNSSTHQQVLTVIGNGPNSMVTIDSEAQDQTIECTNNLDGLMAWLNDNGGASASTDCVDGDNITWSNNFVGLSDECGETGSATVTFTAIDDCGSSMQTTATYRVVDTQGPEIIQPAMDLIVTCDGNFNQADLIPWFNNNGGAIASSTCGGVLWEGTIPPGQMLDSTCMQTTSSTVIFNAIDLCGNATPTTAEFIIEALPTCFGTLEFTSQAQLDAFTENCAFVDGDLIINGDDITDLSNLISIQEVFGSVIIGDSTENVIGNDILVTLEGLNNLASIGGDLLICNNPSITSFSGFSSLRFVGGSVQVKNCILLEFFGWIFDFIGSHIILSGLPSLGEFGPWGLPGVNGDLILNDIGPFGLGGNGGFGDLTFIIGDFFITNNPNLEIVDLPNLISLGGCLHIINNPRLEEDVDLPLVDIGDDIIIMDNDNIANMDQFSDLSTVGGKVLITGNENLSNIDGFSSLIFVGTDFTLSGNPSLSNCCGIYNLLVNNGVTGNINISDNPAGCSSIDDIILTCGPQQNDMDNDGIADGQDNCPEIPNSSQTDMDGDNFGAVCDCNDNDDTINENSVEIADGLDNDCDGAIDLSIQCRDNIVVNIPMGETQTNVSWIPATVISHCQWGFEAGNTGPSNGGIFPLGSTEIIEWVFDGCGEVASCTFTITVVTDLTIICPDNFIWQAAPGADSAQVHWVDPVTSSSCGGINLVQNGGQPRGSMYPLGWTCIAYRATDDCDNEVNCDFCFEVVEYGSSSSSSIVSEVEILHLQSTIVNGNQVKLNWTTNTDYRTEHYIIERSSNGIDFTPIQTINILSQSTQAIVYDVIDDRPLSGNNFYRIYRKDLSTRGQVSNIVSEIINQQEDDFRIFPNPAEDLVFINLAKYEGQQCQVQLINSLGQIIFQNKIFPDPSTPLSIATADFKDGVYLVTVIRKNGPLKTRKLVINKR